MVVLVYPVLCEARTSGIGGCCALRRFVSCVGQVLRQITISRALCGSHHHTKGKIRFCFLDSDSIIVVITRWTKTKNEAPSRQKPQQHSTHGRKSGSRRLRDKLSLSTKIIYYSQCGRTYLYSGHCRRNHVFTD